MGKYPVEDRIWKQIKTLGKKSQKIDKTLVGLEKKLDALIGKRLRKIPPGSGGTKCSACGIRGGNLNCHQCRKYL